LADHFRQETSHPKGCWVVDAILGKPRTPPAAANGEGE
jgi:hypothetical protein